MGWLGALLGALIFLVGYALGIWVGAGQARQRLGDGAWKDELIKALTEGRDTWKAVAEGRQRRIKALGLSPEEPPKRYALNFCSNCGSRYDCEECAEEQG